LFFPPGSSAFFIVSENTFPFHQDHAPDGFVEDAATHFGCALTSIAEDNGDFDKRKTIFPRREFHFNLKCVSFEVYFIEWNGFEYAAPIAFKAGSGVVHFHAGDETDVFRGTV
jgi:hypothetical protein